MSNHFIYLDPSPQATGDGPLTGKRIAVQSNVAVQGWPTAAGSLALENYTALEDATAVARIRAQGGVIVGSSRMSERWQRDLTADGVDPQVIGRRLESSHARLTNSPALIVPCVTMEEMDVYPDAARSEAEYIMAVQSVALACQNLLLAAHDAGLAASWLCAPLFVPKLVCEVLELPQHWRPQAILTLGYAAEQKERDRAPLSSHVVWR